MRIEFPTKESVEELRKRIVDVIENTEDVVGAKVAEHVNTARATFVEKGYAAGFRWGEDAEGKVTLSIEGRNSKMIEGIYKLLYGKKEEENPANAPAPADGIRYCVACYTPCKADDKVCRECGAKIRD